MKVTSKNKFPILVEFAFETEEEIQHFKHIFRWNETIPKLLNKDEKVQKEIQKLMGVITKGMDNAI